MAESNPDTVLKLQADLTRSAEIGKELLEQQQALIEEIEIAHEECRHLKANIEELKLRLTKDDIAENDNSLFAEVKAIANLLQSSHKRIYLLFPEVQQQRDGSSCGVFALAVAHTLAERKDPSSLEFSDEASLRAHLLKCITAKKLAPFYTRQALYKPGKVMKSVMKIYCTCRLPDSGDEMVQCGKCTEWYHFTCVGTSPGTKLKSAYYCSVCDIIGIMITL